MSGTTIHRYTIAFYNIENLFDTENDRMTNDDDFLPASQKRWTKKRYNNKLDKLSQVISTIGPDDADEAPAIIGLAEVENKQVLSDLVHTAPLDLENYAYIHYDSLDERGIDVALLYKPSLFEILDSDTYSIYLENELGERDYTRDVLLVSGILHGEKIHIIVNHWSSRREGAKETAPKRMAAAHKVNDIIDSLNHEFEAPKIIVMGDFNDNPTDDSLSLMESASQLFNPFKTVWSRQKGSLNHAFQWLMFDQILLSHNFFDPKLPFAFDSANVYEPNFLKQHRGKYKGQPFRTFVGPKYKGGYSDHFPVYVTLKVD